MITGVSIHSWSAGTLHTALRECHFQRHNTVTAQDISDCQFIDFDVE